MLVILEVVAIIVGYLVSGFDKGIVHTMQQGNLIMLGISVLVWLILVGIEKL